MRDCCVCVCGDTAIMGSHPRLEHLVCVCVCVMSELAVCVCVCDCLADG